MRFPPPPLRSVDNEIADEATSRSFESRHEARGGVFEGSGGPGESRTLSMVRLRCGYGYGAVYPVGPRLRCGYGYCAVDPVDPRLRCGYGYGAVGPVDPVSTYSIWF
jgi:hypothetical protein